MTTNDTELAHEASTELELPTTTPYGHGLIIAGLHQLKNSRKINAEVHKDVKLLIEHLEHNVPEEDEKIGARAIDRALDLDETPEVSPDER